MKSDQKPPIPQADRFKETARAHGCDEDEAAFKEKLAVIAKQVPLPPAKSPTTKKQEK